MSHRRRGKPTGYAKKSQSSPDILVEEAILDTTEDSGSSETLVDQTDNVDSVFHTSFILDNDTEARQTPVLIRQGRKNNNEEEIKKLAFPTLNMKHFLFYKKNLKSHYHKSR